MRDGSMEERAFTFVYQPITGAGGEVTGIFVHAVDVTAQVRARHEAEAANRAKSDFLAAMSHELRTPLNAIGGYVQLMELGIHGPVTDAQRASLHRVRTNQQHLLRLINDVLAFAKVEAGQLELNPESFEARTMLETIFPLIAPQAAAKRISLSIQSCEPEVHAMGDVERVRQVLLNLVGNAIKFTQPDGAVTLSCSAAADDFVAFRVRDNGPGIAEDQLESIFDPFVQVEDGLTRTQPGAGLGLAISRDLARAMEGTLSVESEIGHGSTFVLDLPVAE
jgi:signal transduction histidine kinase